LQVISYLKHYLQDMKSQKILKIFSKISNTKKIDLLHKFRQTLNTIDEKHLLIPFC